VKDENKRLKPWVFVSDLRYILMLAGVIALLSGCAGSVEWDGSGQSSSDYSDVPDAVPRLEPKSKYGNPDSYVVFGKRYRTKASSTGHVERGVASWYGKKFHGRKTSNGERYDMYAMTAAHKSLPLPTYAKVTNLENGRTAVVRINDRGPFHGARVIDLSYAAASKLGVVRKGTAFVEVKAIDSSKPASGQSGENLFADSGGSASETSRSERTERKAQSRPSVHKERSFAPAPAEGTKVAQKMAPAQTNPKISRTRETQVAQKAAPVANSPASAPAKADVRLASVEEASQSGPTAAAAPAPDPAGVSRLYLQVGAFGSRTNAEQLRRQLVQQLAEQVLVHTADGGMAPLYKVHVGPFDSRQKARNVSQQIASLGLKELHMVTE
jgi:rare lipoprotein A